jgi:hypothetical protein
MSVEALLTEREGYVMRGLLGRVAQVDAQLREWGVIVDDAPIVEMAAPRPGRKRP